MIRYGLSLLLLLQPLPAGAAEIYKWIDEQGRTHYGDKPAGTNAVPLDIDGKAVPVDTDLLYRYGQRDKLLQQIADERQTKQAETDRLAEQAALRKQRCDQVRQKLWQYEHSSYIYEESSSGERQILDDAGRAAEENRLRQYLNVQCR